MSAPAAGHGVRGTAEAAVFASYIEFHEVPGPASGKTRRWIVYAQGGGHLGDVRWFARWRCYGFYPQAETVFERTCLRDIAQFCERETVEQRGRRNR